MSARGAGVRFFSMPPQQAADLEEALQKKGGLTLSQLANYDDLATDALVDKVCAVPAA